MKFSVKIGWYIRLSALGTFFWFDSILQIHLIEKFPKKENEINENKLTKFDLTNQVQTQLSFAETQTSG